MTRVVVDDDDRLSSGGVAERGDCVGPQGESPEGECGPSATADAIHPAPGELGGSLAGKSLLWQVVALSGWPLMQQVMGFLVGFVDTAVAGRVSVEAANAIAVAAYMQWFMGLMFGAVGVGGTALVARSIGANNRALAERALGQSIRLALAAGVVVTVVVWPLAPYIALAAGLTGESLDLSVSYLRIVVVSAVFGSVLMVGGQCLSGAGDTRSPFVVMLVTNVINGILTLWLALPTWGFAGIEIPGLGMGVLGIAIGTAAAWLVGGSLMLIVLLRGGLWLRRRPSDGEPRGAWLQLCPACLRADWPLAWRQLKLGGANFLERLGQWGGNFLVIVIVGIIAVREAEQGAHIIAIRIESLSFLSGFAFAIAASTLTGQYLGAGNPEKAKRAAMVAVALAGSLMGLMGLVFIAVPDVLCRIMTDKEVLIELAAPLVRMCGYVQVPFAAALVLGGAMRGAGDTRTPMLLTNVSTLAVRLPLVAAIGWWAGYGLHGVWVGLLIELSFRGVAFIVAFWRGRWAEVEV